MNGRTCNACRARDRKIVLLAAVRATGPIAQGFQEKPSGDDVTSVLAQALCSASHATGRASGNWRSATKRSDARLKGTVRPTSSLHRSPEAVQSASNARSLADKRPWQPRSWQRGRRR